MQGDRPNFRYLNRDGLWPGFHWDGLELTQDGVLRLIAIPRFLGTLPENFDKLPQPDTPAGLAIDRDGSIYFTSPGSSQLLRVNGCTGAVEAVPCLEGELKMPGALVVSVDTRILFVADPGSGSVVLLDPDSFQVRNVWTGITQPVSLAADSEGNMYIGDAGRHRVDRFRSTGDRVDSFWTHLSSSVSVGDPRLAVDQNSVFILDRSTGRVYVATHNGDLTAEIETGVENAQALAIAGGVLYIADATRGRLVVFHADRHGHFVRRGDAAAYKGPITAIANDGHGGILVAPGSCLAPLTLTIGAGCLSSGVLWSDALAIDKVDHFWNKVHAQITLPEGAHAQFFVYTDKAPPPPVDPTSAEPFSLPWRAIGLDVTDFFVGGLPGPGIAIGARFASDLHASPRLSQLRITFDSESYLANLPAIYRERTCGDFLLRFVSLFESFFTESESLIDALPSLLDAQSTPVEDLPWLATLLAYKLPEAWTESQQRTAVGEAFAKDARRGTVAALIDTLQSEAGIRAVIIEPIQNTGWWALPAQSASCVPGAEGTWTDGATLGFTTVLATAEPQGAVVGTTATLDRSHILASEAYGTPLFEEVAHQFTIQLYRSAVECPGKLDQVKSIIAREAPAHTMYEVCVVDPGIRIGYQCRVGVDTVLGMGDVPTRLGDGPLVLGGELRGELGVTSHVGVDTRL